MPVDACALRTACPRPRQSWPGRAGEVGGRVRWVLKRRSNGDCGNGASANPRRSGSRAVDRLLSRRSARRNPDEWSWSRATAACPSALLPTVLAGRAYPRFVSRLGSRARNRVGAGCSQKKASLTASCSTRLPAPTPSVGSRASGTLDADDDDAPSRALTWRRSTSSLQEHRYRIPTRRPD